MAISGTDWLEVPTIYKAYTRRIFQAYVREYPHQNVALYGTVPPFQDPEIPSDSFLIVKNMNYSHLVNIFINLFMNIPINVWWLDLFPNDL
jgi:hypothetical protein